MLPLPFKNFSDGKADAEQLQPLEQQQRQSSMDCGF
jgi:hypothetical protein